MPSFLINDDEREALRGLPSVSREMYVFGIRPFMDYATGIVGIKRGISWKSIAEELYVEPHQGIDSGEPTEKQLRRGLVWLQKVGLLSQNKAERRLVFELLKATRDQSVRNKVGSKRADQPGIQAAPLKPSIGAACTEEEVRQAAGGKTHKVGTPPVSDLPTTTQRAHEPDRFGMTDNWEPTHKGWTATSTRNGISADLLTPEALGEFRSYWINRPDKHQSQGQWEHSLAQTLKRTTIRSTRHDNGSGTQAGQQRDTSRPRSAVDRVKRAIADRKAREAAATTPGQAVDEDDGDVRPPLDGECRRLS